MLKVVSHKKIIFFSLLVIIIVLNLLSVRHKTPNYDEGLHVKYGIRILQFNPDRFEDSEMPFTCLNAAFYKIAKLLRIDKALIFLTDIDKLIRSEREVIHAILIGRLATICFSVLLAVFIYKWSSELYGVIPGIFSLFCYAFSPNIIAHSRFVTTDLYAAGTMMISAYYFWRFMKSGGWKAAAFSAIALGVSQLAKYTCVLLYPAFLIIIAVRYSRNVFAALSEKNFKKLSEYFTVFTKYLLFFVLVSILIVNIGFMFNKPFTPLKDYEFKSSLFKSIQLNGILKEIPVPYPTTYLQGLDAVRFGEETGHRFSRSYLLEEFRLVGKGYKGFKWFYFYVFLFKVPIAIQLFLLLSFFAYFFSRRRYDFMKNELFVFIPIGVLCIYFNFFLEANIGIRHFLVILPLLYISFGNIVCDWKKMRAGFRYGVITLSVYLVISVLSYFPHYISYFNEIVWNRKQSYKYLVDSNLDWGQNGWYLERYHRKNRDIILDPTGPTAGKIVVAASELAGIYDPERYRWLRENFEPVDHIGYSILIYEVSEEDLSKIQ